MYENIENESARYILKFLTLLNTISFERRAYERERWVEYWIDYFEKELRNLGK